MTLTRFQKRKVLRSEYYRVRGIKRGKQKREYIQMYKLTHPCLDCGEPDPVVLDFDHREPSKKGFTISKVGKNKTLTVLITEIMKCDVRCANCHRRKHHRERVAAL